MQIQTLELFQWVDVQDDKKSVQTRVLRHTITQPNGLIYYQDEYVKLYMPSLAISSERTDWNILSVPAVPDEPVGVFQYAGLFGAVMRSGKSYLFAARVPDKDDEDAQIAYQVFQKAHKIHEWPHEWVEFQGALPETLAHKASK